MYFLTKHNNPREGRFKNQKLDFLCHPNVGMSVEYKDNVLSQQLHSNCDFGNNVILDSVWLEIKEISN